ncbi:hypothetical protein ABEO75_06000, partial [Paenibacillus macerans]
MNYHPVAGQTQQSKGSIIASRFIDVVITSQDTMGATKPAFLLNVTDRGKKYRQINIHCPDALHD